MPLEHLELGPLFGRAETRPVRFSYDSGMPIPALPTTDPSGLGHTIEAGILLTRAAQYLPTGQAAQRRARRTPFLTVVAFAAMVCCAAAACALNRHGVVGAPVGTDRARHPLVASSSPDHYRYNPIHNGETWHFGTYELPRAGAAGYTFELRFWNSSPHPIRVSGFEFSTPPVVGRDYGWRLVTEDTLWVNNTVDRSRHETIELGPEENFRVSLNFGFDKTIAPGDHLATMRMHCDPGGDFEIKVSVTLVRSTQENPESLQ
jgi:hypothetical protein